MREKESFGTRLLALALMITISVGSLSGCGKANENRSAIGTSSTSVETETVERSTTEAAVEAASEETVESEESADTKSSSLANSNDGNAKGEPAGEWESYLGNIDAFVYALLYNELSTSYTVFNGVITLPDGTEVYGLGYTDYTSYLQRVDNNKKGYFPAGFIGYIGEPAIPADETDNAIIIQDVDNDNIQYPYVFAYNPEPFMEHCVIWNEYLRYGVGDDGCITYKAEPFDKEKCDLSLGALYSYDDQKYLYDPDVGNAVKVTGTSLVDNIDYDELEAEINRILEEQDYNFSEADVKSIVYESKDAIDSYWLQHQNETFMGFKVKDLIEISQQLDPMECIQFTSDGMVTVDMNAAPPKEPEAYVKWITGICCGAAIAAGVACSILVPGTAPVAGALSAAGTEVFMEVVVQNQSLENVNWGKVAVAAASAAALAWVCPILAQSATEAVFNNATSTTIELFGKQVAVKGLAKLAGYSVQTLSTSVVSGVTSAAFKALDGGTKEEIGNAFAIGAAMAAVMTVAGIGIEEGGERLISSRIQNNRKGFMAKLVDKTSQLSQKIEDHQVKLFQNEKVEEILVPKSVNEAANAAENELNSKREALASRVRQLPSATNGDMQITNEAGNIATKDELLNNDGNGYITLKDGCDSAFRKEWESRNVTKLEVTDGEVDLEPFSVETVKGIKITSNRKDNFSRTYGVLADQWSADDSTIPEVVKNQLKKDGITDFGTITNATVQKVLKECNLTIHETSHDTIMLVPTVIHEHISHAGGVAAAKVMETIQVCNTYFHHLCYPAVSGVFGTLIAEGASQ